jgi:YbbR domain-containing protein
MTWLRTTGLRILLALGLSLALWIFVAYTENPEQRTTFGNVPVKIENVGTQLLIVDSDGTPRTDEPQVELLVEADLETLRDLRQSDLKAFVDMTGRGPGEHVVPVNVVPTRSGLTRVRITPNPQNVAIRLEQTMTRTVPLEVRVTGNVPFSYVAEPPIVTYRGQPIREAQVNGPQSRVDRVAAVLATADIDRLTANYNSPRLLVPLTDAGTPVLGVTVDPQQVDVLVPISSSAGTKRVPIVPSVRGNPASGYVVTGVAIAPQFVTLTGSSGPLDRVRNVETAPVDITGASGTNSYVAAIQPPGDALLQAGEPTTVTVTVALAPIERSFSVTLPMPIQATNFPPGYLVSISPGVVQLTLSGTTAALAALDPGTLRGTFSVQGLPPGTYIATPVYALPEGITIDGPPPQVSVTLRVPPPTVTPSSTPAPNPSPEPTERPTPAASPPAGPTEPPAPTATP